jgi:SAM-dependent methyltransferase
MERTDRSTQRYLTAKRTVDDRALNEDVFDRFEAALTESTRLLEVAAGVGTMLNRLIERESLPQNVTYTLLDIDPANVAAANDRIAPGARAHGYDVSAGKPPTDLFPDADASFVLTLSRAGRRVRVEAGSTDVFEFVSRVAGNRSWDVLIGGAFLDIVPGVDPVASLFELVPGGAFYFPITFDGATRFLPATADHAFERRLERRWHAGMRSGDDPNDPRAGSRLPGWVRAAGGSVAAMGGSDWIVRPGESEYPADEEYFLRHVLGFVEGSLSGDPELPDERVRRWVDRRREQLDAANLTYVAHNLDVTGMVGSTDTNAG